MSENQETKWEDLRAGERVELGLVQIDIARHSQIEGDPPSIKKAKDIFADEMEKIAIAHGGKLFKWEGDGGCFMFRTREGEVFNRLVNAALEMLGSMSAINKKIAAETELENPFHVRISCDSGMVEFDQNQGRISAEVINNFRKNERAISLEDNVCITERIYKELKTHLRSRFSFYKHSPEIRGDLYCLVRNKTSTSWTYIVTAVVVGIILGLVFAFILAKRGLWVNQNPPVRPETEKIVIIFGSGTVNLHLKAIKPNFFDDLKKNEGIDVQIMDGPTLTGAKSFSYSYDQGPVLVMASKRLSIGDLQRYKEKGREMPKAAFEAYLGEDPVQLLLVVEKGDERNPNLNDDYILEKALPDFNEPTLTVEALAQIFAKRDKDPAKGDKDSYRIYVGSDETGTQGVWQDLFKEKKLMWPSGIELWESKSGQETIRTGKPKIFLGSKIQNERAIATLEGHPFAKRTVQIIDEGKDVKRGLYLYGLVKEGREQRGNGYGFDLQKPVAITLNYVFRVLENSPSIDPKCRTDQIDYFNLGPNVEGWVGENTDDHGIYRIGYCDKRAKK